MMKKQLMWFFVSAALITIIIVSSIYFILTLRKQFLDDVFFDLKTEVHMVFAQIQAIENTMDQTVSELAKKIESFYQNHSKIEETLKAYYAQNSFVERIILKDKNKIFVDISNRFSQNIYQINSDESIIQHEIIKRKKVTTHAFEKNVRISFIMPVFASDDQLLNLMFIIDPQKVFKMVFSSLYIAQNGHPWVLYHSKNVRFLLCDNCFEFSSQTTRLILSDFAIGHSGSGIVYGRLPNQIKRSAQKLITTYLPISFFETSYMIGYIVSHPSVIGKLDQIIYILIGAFIVILSITGLFWNSLFRKQTNEIEKEKVLRQTAETERDEALFSNQTKTDFITNMSHEIRTPMNGIIGMNALLLETRLDSIQYQYAQTVKTSAYSLLAIINDILDFSNIETGQIQLDEKLFNLRDVLEELADMMAARAFEKGLEFNLFIPNDIPLTFIGDSIRLRQVLSNLVSNAIKFTDKGEVILDISVEKENEINALIRFTVSDTGLGVPKERMDRLFKPFSQVDMSLTRNYGGVGLGLIISKQLVEKMGGEIGMTSVERKGSRFWFTADLVKNVKNEETKPIIPERLEHSKALIVDKHITNRKLLKANLKHWNCQVKEADDGISALEQLKQSAIENHVFDFIIINMKLPGMDGKTLATAIKKEPELKHIPLVMLTSVLNHQEQQNYQTYGFSSFFMKPVKQSHMQQAILKAIGTIEKQPTASKKKYQSDLKTYPIFNNLFVLIVEDNIVNQQVTENMLIKLGCRSKIANNGIEALELLEKTDFDLVLMDIQMPKMDGLTATKSIRDSLSKVKKHHIPIIAMTAHALRGHREKCFQAGMNDYLTKPLSIDLLAKAIEKTGVASSIQSIKHDKNKTAPCQDNDKTKRNIQLNKKKVKPDNGQKIDPEIFDRNSLKARVGGNEQVLESIVQLFINETPKQMNDLKNAIVAKDSKTATNIAHSIKGSAGNFGALKMRTIAYDIEKLCRENHLDKAKEMFNQLELSYETLKDYMH
jgi:signal transduction histidine kinase/DNA-binding response OmpR family regulator